MRRIIISTIFLLLFIACTTPTGRVNSNGDKIETQYLKVEKAILDFATAHPNWAQNDVIQEKTCDSLTQQLKPLIKEGLYDDLPFKFDAVEEFVEKGKKGYLALFNFDKERYDYDRISHDFLLSIYGIVDDKMLNQLKQGDIYYVKGDLLKFKSDKFYLMTKGSNDKSIGTVLLPNIRIKVKEVIPVTLQ
jgi:hypothetical protein